MPFLTIRTQIVDDRPEHHLEGYVACPACSKTARYQIWDEPAITSGTVFGVAQCPNPDGECGQSFIVAVTFRVLVEAASLPPF